MNRTKNILYISPDFNYSCGVSKHVYSLLKGLQGDQSYKLFFITNGGDALDKLDSINIKAEILNFSKGLKNIFNIYSNIKALKEFCHENKIDVIHTHHRYPEFLANLISKAAEIKTITTVHSLVKGKNKLSFKSDRVIAVSNSVKDLLKNNYNVPDEKITMLYNFVDFFDSNKQFLDPKIRTKLGIPEGNSIILFLGRVTKIKGVDLLIEAFKILKQKGKKISLLIIGQVYDNSLKNLLKNLPEGIQFLDVVKEPYPYYAIADLLVLPSRIDPFPYVMLEAGLMHKPFIGARTGGIAEFIGDGENGILFNPGNSIELSGKIEYLLDNPQSAKAFAENLYEKVKRQMSCKEYITQLTLIYDSLLIDK